jgi:hypothetical protein
VPARTYFDAAKFYVERDMDLGLAASWVEKAVDEQPGAFWMVWASIFLRKGSKCIARAMFIIVPTKSVSCVWVKYRL